MTGRGIGANVEGLVKNGMIDGAEPSGHLQRTLTEGLWFSGCLSCAKSPAYRPMC